MARMPDIAAELEADWDHDTGALRHVLAAHMPHWHGIQTPARKPVTVGINPKETPMSLAADLHAAAERLDKIGEEAVSKLEEITASPAGAAALDVVHAVTGLNIDPKIIDEALGGLRSLLLAYAPAQPEQPAPAPAPAPSGQ